jgi:PAS domain S-box-containing protein
MIDIRTVIFSYVISNAICTIVMASMWLRNRRRFTGLGFWLADFAIQSIALLLAVSRGILPDFITIVMPNTLVIAGTILMLIGLERFTGERAYPTPYGGTAGMMSQLHNYILLAVFICVYTWVTFFQPSQLNRTIAFSLALIFVLAQSTWLMFRRVKPHLRSITSGVGIIFLVACLIALSRIIVDLMVDPGNDFFKFGLYDTLYVLVNQMLFIGLTFGLVLMVNRRLIANMEFDINRRKQTEAALQESHDLFTKVFHLTPAAMIITRLADGCIVEVNNGFEQMLGYQLEEVIGHSVIEINIYDDPNEWKRIESMMRNRAFFANYEPKLCTRSGAVRDVLASAQKIEVKGETSILSIFYDITERKQMDSALQYRTNVLEALHQVTLELVNRHELDDILQTLLVKIGALLDASDISFDLVENNDTLVTYAVTSDQPLQKGDRMRRGEGGWLSWQAIESGQPAVLEDYSTWPKRRLLFEGYPIHAVMIIPIHQRGGVIGAINISRNQANKPFNDTDMYVAKQLAQMMALVLDNAQLYSQLQAKLYESVRREETLHETQAQVIEQQRTLATFEERRRMARDLHDSVNQSIHSLVLFSETLVSALEKNNVNRVKQIAERLQESARQALKETRLLLYQTQMSGKERGANLIEELNARLENVELRAGVRAQVLLNGSMDDCPQEWRENLFWITIEALNNSLKHAQARNMQIIIRCSPQCVELEVVDDGKGFDTSGPRPGGYGLRNMQERADALGGKLTFASTFTKGTSVLFHAERAERAEIKE